MNMIGITKQQLDIVNRIDQHVSQFPENDGGSEQLLMTIYDYMESFKMVMDTTTRVQMDYLSQNYSGFYRFGKLLELMAEGIASGTIKVPRDH